MSRTSFELSFQIQTPDGHYFLHYTKLLLLPFAPGIGMEVETHALGGQRIVVERVFLDEYDGGGYSVTMATVSLPDDAAVDLADTILQREGWSTA